MKDSNIPLENIDLLLDDINKTKHDPLAENNPNIANPLGLHPHKLIEKLEKDKNFKKIEELVPPLLILISGGTMAGKSTIAQQLEKHIKNNMLQNKEKKK